MPRERGIVSSWLTGALYVADRGGSHAGWQAQSLLWWQYWGMEDIVDFNTQVPEEAEQLDQLQEGDSLINRGVDDVLDEGYTTPERWSVAQASATPSRRCTRARPSSSGSGRSNRSFTMMLPPGTLRGRNARLDGRELAV